MPFRLASQIYEADDLDCFKPKEIAQLLDTSQQAVQYAIDYRHEIEPKITRALRTLYPKEDIRVPYRTKTK